MFKFIKNLFKTRKSKAITAMLNAFIQEVAAGNSIILIKVANYKERTETYRRLTIKYVDEHIITFSSKDYAGDMTIFSKDLVSFCSCKPSDLIY